MTSITPFEIDKINLTGYSKLAKEYIENKRLTTANFHTLSEGFFCKEIEKHTKTRSLVLDLGSGQGYLHKFFDACSFNDYLPKEYLAIDLSIGMLQKIMPTPITKKICATSFSLPLKNNSIDIILSSLIASFLTEVAIKEIFRILKPEGILAFSTPTQIWSSAIRDTNRPNMTKFKMDDGQDVWVYSFTYGNAELIEMMKKNGFEITDFQIATGKFLLENNFTISPAISEASNKLDIPLADIPILQLVEAQKVRAI